jgi:hypothetical protein
VALDERHNENILRKNLRDGGSRFLRVALIVPLDSTRRVNQLLLAREKRMTVRANFQFQIADRRARFERVAANACDDGFLVLRMDACFHFLSVPKLSDVGDFEALSR